MSKRGITESAVEAAALDLLHAVGCWVTHGPDIAPDTLLAERASYGEVVLTQRPCDARSSPRLQEGRKAGT